jgi:hypothetical protein
MNHNCSRNLLGGISYKYETLIHNFFSAVGHAGTYSIQPTANQCAAYIYRQTRSKMGRKISICHVTVSEIQIIVQGTNALPDGDCVHTEQFAGEDPLSWWPTDACGQVQEKEWELIVPLDGHTIDASVDNVIKAYLDASDENADILIFDTAGPPQP